MIMNGCYEKRGQWTFIGEVGTLVIDYVVANEKIMEVIKEVKERDKTESDHVLLED